MSVAVTGSVGSGRPYVVSLWVRAAAAAALFVSGVAHLPPLGIHLGEVPYIGISFAVLITVCMSAAVGLVVDGRPAWWWLSALAVATALVLFVISRTSGLPQLGDDIGNWSEPAGWVALMGESVTLIVCLAALPTVIRRWRRAG